MATKISTEQFIEKAKAVHGDKYSYEKTVYVNAKTDVLIIYEGIEYLQNPKCHLRGCSPENNPNKELEIRKINFIEKAKIIHSDRYSYDKTIYVNRYSKVIIILNGVEYLQTPANHLKGYKPELCLNDFSLSFKHNFIKKAIQLYQNTYDYSLVEYINNTTKVIIIFEGQQYLQTPAQHLNGYRPEIVAYNKIKNNIVKQKVEKNKPVKQKVEKVKPIKQKVEKNKPVKQKVEKVKIKKEVKTKSEIFIEKARKVHGDKYDYDKVDYIKSNMNIIIIYNGIEYLQRPTYHLSGKCPEKSSNLNKILTKEDFINKAIIVHGYKYDYSLVDFKGVSKKIIIIYNNEEFLQKPSGHLKGKKPECFSIKNKEKLRDDFIKKAIKIHGEIFDYSLVEYVNYYTPIKILYNNIVYLQTPLTHLKHNNIIVNKRLMTTEKFIIKANHIHNYKYDYTQTIYVDLKTPIKIIYDNVIYLQTPRAHLDGKCPEKNTLRSTIEDFIKRAENIYGKKYDYSKAKYKNCDTPILIIYEGKEYYQTPYSHLNGVLPENMFQKLTIEDFIERCDIIHDFKFDYSLVEFENKYDIIKIIYNGEVFYQNLYQHLMGKTPYGSVKSLSKGSNKIKKYLESENIFFYKEYRFKECRNINPLPFDFYLPDFNMLIEYDGEQHFKPVKMYGGEEGLKNTQMRDDIKTEFGRNNTYGLRLLRIRYDEVKFVEEILKRELV